MKKMLLGAVGLSAMLASCGGVEVIAPVSNLQLTSYQSEYVLKQRAVDQDGNVYDAGASVICDNTTTRIGFTAKWNGSINQIGARLEGRDTGRTAEVYSGSLGNLYSYGSDVQFEFGVGAGLAPQTVGKRSLSAQDIIVKPINTIRVKGASFLIIQARSADGTISNVSPSVQALPIADCVL
ncbi:hypothetical protein [Deinococcus budaensis]|uniref:Lipoprotein n=1 Tax=Deinococcus budaensis TaxID=1665626 RepID=A0A7W8GDS9_9DEIO|nr:hypothetical protein [Deinococcus budaensis]MBB5233446.1 hypothetical protein [Deinococcus budaensis]